MAKTAEFKLLLVEAPLPASTVAIATGFADQSHFTRHFKRIVQVTPNQYAGRPVAARAGSRLNAAVAYGGRVARRARAHGTESA